jgi:7-cyano-7-deazaguanine synthase
VSSPRAIVLLSGGLDSTTCLAIAVEEGFTITALSFDYGQRHRAELEAARRVAAHYAVDEHRVVDLAFFRQLGGSALTDDVAVPMDRDPSAGGIPVTYVPARNLVFLSLALGVAEVRGAFDLFIGVNALDYSGYPDCRPAFIEQMERTANLALRAGVEGASFRIRAPLLHWSKAEIIARGLELGVPHHLTLTCYAPDPGGVSCGRCDACQLRRRGFEAAGGVDPIPYR